MSEVPIRFFNQTFEKIFSNKGAERVRPYETAPQPIIRPGVITNRNAAEGSVSIYLTEGPAQGGEQTAAEASLVVDIIEGIRGKRGRETYEYKTFGDIRAKIGSSRTAIGILFFSFTHIKIYEEVLREAGLPFIVHRGKGFFRRTLAERFTPSELIRRIILDRGLTAILSVHPNGQQKIANMEKLVDLARAFQENGEGSIRDFVAYGLEMAGEEEEEGEAIIITDRDCPICLMTIHAAKGLEFPLVIISQLSRMKERKKNGKNPELNSDDYREKATIIEMLDDIFDFHSPPFPDLPDDDRPGAGAPKIIWPETHLKFFAGIRYKSLAIEKTFFRPYDQRVAALDLSGPIQTPSYYQLSFKSIRYFRECPLKFYYGVVLGLKAEEWDLEDETHAPHLGPGDDHNHNDDRCYDSRESLLVGSVIHAYLEKHRFGKTLDHDLLEQIWSHYETQNGFSGASSQKINPGLRSTIQRHLTNVAEDEHLAQLLGSGRSYLEVPFLFSVGRGHDFRGFIDCLVRRPESGQWVILDWKSNDLTGRDPVQIAEENDYHLQLACYGWALEEMRGEKPEALYLYFTDQGVRLDSHWEDDPKEVVKELIGSSRAYEKDGKLAVKEIRERVGGLPCRFCEYKGMSACLNLRAD